MREFKGQQAGLVDQLLPGLAAQGNGHSRGAGQPSFDDEVATEAASPCREEEAPALPSSPSQGAPAPCSTACSRPSTSRREARALAEQHRRPAAQEVRLRAGAQVLHHGWRRCWIPPETGLGIRVRLRDLAL